MRSEKKFLMALFAVIALISVVGCNRNKQAAQAPVATGYAPAQPMVAASAPAPVARRSSNYIK